MALTAKPISTISYNTKPFIEDKLNQLINAHIISDYRYISHKGEEGDKDHIHLLLYPNKRIDTGLLQDEFIEIVPWEVKPLKCLPFRQSKPDHWLMYALHDPKYLFIHKSDNDGDGKIEYQLSDINTYYYEQLERDYKRSLSLRQTENQKVIDLISQGCTKSQIIYQENINPMKVQAIYQILYLDQIEREKQEREMERELINGKNLEHKEN